jgi:hypothetical protein
MKKNVKKIVLFFFTGTILLSCKRPEKTVAPIISNEELTTIQLKLTNTVNAVDTLTAQWQQLLDANGNPLPVDTSKAVLTLTANATYTCSLLIYDKSQNPVVNVTTEIYYRRNYHLFFYQPTPITTQNLIISNTSTDIPGTPTSTSGSYLNLTVIRTDYDTNNPPLQVGLSTNFVTGAASSGRLRVVLRHQPDAKNGTYAPGSSDLDINFSVIIN